MYAAERISASYGRVADALEPCEGLSLTSALDIGCGAGHDSFGLAALFDRVVAVDTRRRSLRAARRVAAATSVDRVRFVHADAERFAPGRPVDLVWCNVMSHNARSRVRLLERIRAATAPGGWLVYSEECEGYPPMELARAIVRRDGSETLERARQTVNGVHGRPGFRFYVAGTAAPILEELGYAVVHRTVESWQGLVYLERLWCRATTGPRGEIRGDADYLTRSDDLAGLAECSRSLATGRHLLPVERQALATQANGGGRLARLAAVLVAADGLDRPPAVRLTLRERVVGRRPDEKAWTRIEAAIDS